MLTFFVKKMLSAYHISAAYFQMDLRLILSRKQALPKSKGNSLIWVHIVYNIGNQSRKAEEREQKAFVINGGKRVKA